MRMRMALEGQLRGVMSFAFWTTAMHPRSHPTRRRRASQSPLLATDHMTVVSCTVTGTGRGCDDSRTGTAATASSGIAVEQLRVVDVGLGSADALAMQGRHASSERREPRRGLAVILHRLADRTCTPGSSEKSMACVDEGRY